MNFDEGICYFTITPSETNPLLEDLSRFRKKYEWFGVLHPDKYPLIPFQINFRSLTPKTEEERDRFERILSMKIEIAWRTVIKGLLDSEGIQDTYVESWLEVVRGTTLLNTGLKIFSEMIYGEVFNSLMQVITSEIIRGLPDLEKKYNYVITLDRLQPNALLLGTLHKEQLRDRFVQRLYDEDIRISAYKWDLGVNIRKKYLWKKSWSTFLEPHI